MCVSGIQIHKLTEMRVEETSVPPPVGEKTAMVRAARQLLSAITKVLILADKVVIKQVIAAKDKVTFHNYHNYIYLIIFYLIDIFIISCGLII